MQSKDRRRVWALGATRAKLQARELDRRVSWSGLYRLCRHPSPRRLHPRRFDLGYSYQSVTLRSHSAGMQTQVSTELVDRTWIDKILLWRRAYQTRVFDSRREAIGRGPTEDASRDAAH